MGFFLNQAFKTGAGGLIRLGKFLLLKLWRGVEKCKLPVPAPVIIVENTLEHLDHASQALRMGQNDVVWKGEFDPFRPPGVIPSGVPGRWGWIMGHGSPESFVAILRNARIHADRFTGVVSLRTATGMVLDDLMPIWKPRGSVTRLGESYTLWPPRLLGGRSLLLHADASRNYYHWMCDVLPRYYLCHTAGLNWDDFDWVIADAHQAHFSGESLMRLGCPFEKVINPYENRNLQLESLYAPSAYDVSGVPRRRPQQWIANAVLSAADPSSLSVSRRILIDRLPGSSQGRRFLNRGDVISIFKRYGFETIVCEELSLIEQARIFREASHVAGAHGAGLANCMFCHPGTRVMEMIAGDYPSQMFWVLSDQLGLRYGCFNALAKWGSPRGNHPDLLVDPDALERLLKEWV